MVTLQLFWVVLMVAALLLGCLFSVGLMMREGRRARLRLKRLVTACDQFHGESGGRSELLAGLLSERGVVASDLELAPVHEAESGLLKLILSAGPEEGAAGAPEAINQLNQLRAAYLSLNALTVEQGDIGADGEGSGEEVVNERREVPEAAAASSSDEDGQAAQLTQALEVVGKTLREILGEVDGLPGGAALAEVGTDLLNGITALMDPDSQTDVADALSVYPELISLIEKVIDDYGRLFSGQAEGDSSAIWGRMVGRVEQATKNVGWILAPVTAVEAGPGETGESDAPDEIIIEGTVVIAPESIPDEALDATMIDLSAQEDISVIGPDDSGGEDEEVIDLEGLVAQLEADLYPSGDEAPK